MVQLFFSIKFVSHQLDRLSNLGN